MIPVSTIRGTVDDRPAVRLDRLDRLDPPGAQPDARRPVVWRCERVEPDAMEAYA